MPALHPGTIVSHGSGHGDWLRLEHIGKGFGSGWRKKKILPLFKEISFCVEVGETLGIMGHSGVGKTTLGRIIAGLDTPTFGSVRFNGKDIYRLKNLESRQFRRKVQMIFQDPEGSFNPVKTLRRSLQDVLRLIKCPPNQWDSVIERSLHDVGLTPPILERYPHQLSGGMNQRAALARVLLLEPELIILDEPTSALDVTVQAHILNLLNRLKKEKSLSYILISHDIRVIESMSDRAGIMKDGGFILL